MTDKITFLKHPDPADPLRCVGVGRDGENNKALFVIFNRPPSDDEMRFLADAMDRAAIMCRAGRGG
uniref:hypothetical protein n=1 Tax=Stappia sp. TaxID=1870903 RepID=UPI003BAD7A5A